MKKVTPDIDERGICFYYSGVFPTVDTVCSTVCTDLSGNCKMFPECARSLNK